jgi:hypothetical protein
MEGGISQIGDKWYECGWIAAVNKEVRLPPLLETANVRIELLIWFFLAQGTVGLGSSARFEMPPRILAMVQSGMELGDVMDAVTGIVSYDRASELSSCRLTFTDGCPGQTDVRSDQGAMVWTAFLKISSSHMSS